MTRLARRQDGTALLDDGDGFVPLAAAAPDLDSIAAALPRAAAGNLPATGDAPHSPVAADTLTLGSPLPDPGKLWGIGLNYADHATDLDEQRPEAPASFMKPGTAVTGPGGPIRLPPSEQSERVTAEAELAVVVGRTCRDVAPEDAHEVVAGILPVVDMTAEDVLRRNPRFLTRAKSYDTFLVFGPWLRVVETAADLDADRTVRTVLNDEVVAENTASNMLFSPRELVAFHSRVMTLEPGDVISTGTPGAGEISPGDSVRAAVEGVGSVEAPVVR